MAVHLNILSKFSGDGFTAAQKQLKGLTGSVKGLAGALGIGLGLGALTAGLNAAGQAASADIKSQTLLANQLRNTALATDEQIASAEEYIKSLQMTAAIADDELRPALASLVRATGSLDSAQKLLTLSTDIAAGTGKDLGAVSLAVGKAAAGQRTQLDRLVPSLRGVSDWAGAATAQFDGMAAAAAENDPYQRLGVLFGEIQETVGAALVPAMQELADYLSSIEGQQQLNGLITAFSEAAGFAGELVGYLVDNAEAIPPLISLIGGMTIAWGALEIAVLAYNASTLSAIALTNGLKAALLTSGVGIAVLGLGALAGGFITAGNEADTAAAKVTNFGNALNQIPKPITSDAGAFYGTTTGEIRNPMDGQTTTWFSGGEWYTATYDAKKGEWSKPKLYRKGGTATASKAAAKTKAVDAVAEYYKGIADETQKQTARIRLQGLGASEELIDSILGSGADWKKVYDDVIKTGASGVQKLQAQFNKTATGLKVIQDAQEELRQKSKDAYDEIINKIDDVEDSLIGAAGAVRKLAETSEELGTFESEVVDAFENVKESILGAFDTDVLSNEQLTSLQNFANKEEAILRQIGRQRDALAQKKSLVESVMSDVRESLTGLANINSFLTSQTTTVTQSMTRVIGDLRLTTSETKEIVTTQNDVVAGFTGILQKTRTFVDNLKKLRQLGLTGDLFKQIVDAGVDAGGATAEALIAGGSEIIREVNSLYKDIQTEAGTAAEETAQYLYGSGIDLTNGIITGLEAQQKTLTDSAKSLGQSWADAFVAEVRKAISDAAALAALSTGQSIPAPYTNAVSFVEQIRTDPDLASFVNQGSQYSATLRDFADMTRGTSQTPINVQLNLDGKIVAQSLIKLEKQSGAIWVRA